MSKMNNSIKNYEVFSIAERSNLFYDVILESIVIYKDRFKELLKEMGTPMAKEILGLQKKDVETRNNNFDLTSSNDSISFVPDRKFQDIMKMGPVYTMVDIKRFTTTKFDKYPDAKLIWDEVGLEVPTELKLAPGMKGSIGPKRMTSARTKKTYVAFYPLDKNLTPIPANVKYLQEDPGFKQSELTRSVQEIKAGRGMKSLLVSAGMDKTDKEIEEFVNGFKTAYDILNNAFRFFDIVEGEDIRKCYNYNNYESECNGQLGNSCMKSPNCSKFFDIYCLNPEKCKLIILKAGKTKGIGKIKGRALLWKLDDGRTLMDRIYTNNDSDIKLFLEFGKKNGWIHKDNLRDSVSVTLNPIEYKLFPYMDTLTIYYNNAHILSNSHELDGFKTAACYSLRSTSGGYSTQRSCPYCHGSKFKVCEECGGNSYKGCPTCKGNCKIKCDKCGGVKYKPNDNFKFPQDADSPIINTVDDQIKIGSVVRTNASGSGVMDAGRTIEGIVCYIKQREFYIAQNKHEGSDCGGNKFGFKYTWSVRLDNRMAWINFGELSSDSNPPCDVCNGTGSRTCATCKGSGHIPCETCKSGKKKERCNCI